MDNIYRIFIEQMNLAGRMLRLPKPDIPSMLFCVYLSEYCTASVHGRKQCGKSTWIANNAEGAFVISNLSADQYKVLNPDFDSLVFSPGELLDKEFLGEHYCDVMDCDKVFIDDSSAILDHWVDFNEKLYDILVELYGIDIEVYHIG